MPSRTVIQRGLEPLIGSRFQPTGFPDLGAAVFDRPNGDGSTQRALLVESAQSMAHHLAGTLWDSGSNQPVELIADLPWIRVVAADDDRYLTSSRTESHRLASAFVKHSDIDGEPMIQVVKDRLGLRDDTPLAPREIARAIFSLDPLCLLHGVFFADNQWPGQPRIARAVTGMIEAYDVAEAVSGGVKRDHVRHALDRDVVGGSGEGYGSVPFQRIEFTAREITASFVVDRDQIASYGLGAAATELLENLALYEIRSLLDHGLRMRTACDLTVLDGGRGELPSSAELTDRVREGVELVRESVDQRGARTVVWTGGKAKKARK